MERVQSPQRTQDFREDENQDHADEETGLLGGTPDTSVTNNANSKTCGETGKADSKARAKLDEAGEEGEFLLELVGDQDRYHQPVDTDDTSHDDGDDVCGTFVNLCLLV